MAVFSFMVYYAYMRLVELFKRHRQLIRRRGFKAHINLERRFREIDRDPWVQKGREYYAEHPGKYIK